MSSAMTVAASMRPRTLGRRTPRLRMLVLVVLVVLVLVLLPAGAGAQRHRLPRDERRRADRRLADEVADGPRSDRAERVPSRCSPGAEPRRCATASAAADPLELVAECVRSRHHARCAHPPTLACETVDLRS